MSLPAEWVALRERIAATLPEYATDRDGDSNCKPRRELIEWNSTDSNPDLTGAIWWFSYWRGKFPAADAFCAAVIAREFPEAKVEAACVGPYSHGTEITTAARVLFAEATRLTDLAERESHPVLGGEDRG